MLQKTDLDFLKVLLVKHRALSFQFCGEIVDIITNMFPRIIAPPHKISVSNIRM